MTIAQRLGQVNRDLEHNAARGEFFKLARLLLTARGNPIEALRLAQHTRATPRIIDILKSGVSGGNLTDWSTIADYRNISAAFSESLRTASVFDALLAGGMVPAPLRTRGITVTTGISGSSVLEGQVKPISSLALDNALVEPRKSAAFVVVTRELANFADANTVALFNHELLKGVAAATDATFLAACIAATTPTGSAGSTLANITTDLGVLLAAVTNGSGSQLYFVLDPTNAKKLALKATTSGALAFPAFNITGGGELIPGVTNLVSDQLPAGTALLIAADGLAGSADVVTLDASEQAVIQMSTSPDSPTVAGTVMLNLFQTDHRAVRAERHYGFVIHRSTAVASLSGVSY